MKMWKLLCYDIKYGCIKNLKLLLFPVIFEMAVLFMLWQKMNSYAQYGISTQSIWEMFCYIISVVWKNIKCLWKMCFNFQ